MSEWLATRAAWKHAPNSPQYRFISITSFNVWAESTQIEPAVPITVNQIQYFAYPANNPYYYLDITRDQSMGFFGE